MQHDNVVAKHAMHHFMYQFYMLKILAFIYNKKNETLQWCAHPCSTVEMFPLVRLNFLKHKSNFVWIVFPTSPMTS